MKQSSRKLLSLLMAFAICLSLLPGSALAADGTIQNGQIEIISGNKSGQIAPGETVYLVAVGPTRDDEDITDIHWNIVKGVGVAEIEAVQGTKAGTSVKAASNATPGATFTIRVEYACKTLGGGADTKYSAEREFTIVAPTVTGIQISSSTPTTIRVGQSTTFEALITPEGADATVTWSSSDSTVATIDSASGRVTALKAGETTITAAVSGTSLKDTKKLTVISAEPSTLTVELDKSSYKGGEIMHITANYPGAAGYYFNVGVDNGYGITVPVEWPSTTVTRWTSDSGETTWRCPDVTSTYSNAVINCVALDASGKPLTNGKETAFTLTPGTNASVTLEKTATVAVGGDITLHATVNNIPANQLGNYGIYWRYASTLISPLGEGTFTGSTNAQTFRCRATNTTGKTQIIAELQDKATRTTIANATCDVTITSSANLTLTPASVSVSDGRVTSYTVAPASIAAWPTASYIDWSVSSGTGTAWIDSSNSSSSSQWGLTERTARTANGTIPGVYVYGRASGTATLTAILKNSTGVELARGSVSITVGSNVLTPSSTSVTVPYGAWSNYFSVSTTAANASFVNWSVPSNQGVVYLSNNRTTNNNGGYSYSVDTSLNNNRSTGIYLYGLRNGASTTLTATLYDNRGSRLGYIEIPVTVGTSAFTLSPDPSNTSAVYLNDYWTGNTTGYSRLFSVTPYLNGRVINSSNYSGYNVSYVWTLNGNIVQTYATSSSQNSPSYRLYSNNQYLNSYYWNNNRYNVLTCTAYVSTNGSTATPGNAAYSTDVSWNIYTNYASQFSVGVTVYDSNPGYALTDTPDTGNTSSIADQIDTWVRNNYRYGTSSNYYRNYEVRVSGGTAYESGSSGNRGTLTTNSNWLSYSDLNKIVFTPGSSVSSSTGSYQISFNFDVRLYDSYYGSGNYDTATGTMVFTVRQGTASGGDISYSAELGKDVTFSVSDFETFWSNLYSRGSLSYVTFGTVSGGTVYNSSNKSAGSTSYYVNPSRNQSGLDGMYFSPNSTTSRSATTIRIPFTAHGTTSTSSSSTTSRSGTIIITYLSSAASTITYSTNASGTVSLRAQDFIDAYKAAVNTSSTPSNLTIVFQNVPSYGTLSYKDSSKSSSSSVRLTNSNIKSRSFTTRSSGTNQLGDVTYTASGSRTETISYIGYIGSTATFTGEVSFNAATAPTNVPVSFTCYTTAGIPMSFSNFSLASPTAMANAGYITFGTPRTGRLTNAGGTTLGSTPVLVSQLGNVTYIPSGTTTVTSDSFAFTAYDTNSRVVASGTVTVTVSLPANPNAITSISQFTDIPAPGPTSDWYRPQLTALINKGVINGKGDGKFGPEDALTYGEALKMIMNAAGYYEAEANENQAGVSHWAQNYKNTAVQRGWLQSSVNLRNTISRDSMAELTARVLGISAATNQTSPFADSTNAYAIALYNSKIVQGELWDDGSRHFTPNKALTRNEMVCLVYNMYQFTGK